MANREFKRLNREDAVKELLVANTKGSACPSEGTEYSLTGAFVIEWGYEDKSNPKRERIHTDRAYAFFEGSKRVPRADAPTAVEGGINGSLFIRRPFQDWTEEELAQQSEFQRGLNDCHNAGELYDLLDRSNAFGRKIVVKKVIRHSEIPYGRDKEQPVPYAFFDLV